MQSECLLASIPRRYLLLLCEDGLTSSAQTLCYLQKSDTHCAYRIANDRHLPAGKQRPSDHGNSEPSMKAMRVDVRSHLQSISTEVGRTPSLAKNKIQQLVPAQMVVTRILQWPNPLRCLKTRPCQDLKPMFRRRHRTNSCTPPKSDREARNKSRPTIHPPSQSPIDQS